MADQGFTATRISPAKARDVWMRRNAGWILLWLALGGLCAEWASASSDRLSIHVTQDEVEIWKLRAVAGPYRRAGDAQANSPGDWERIKRNAEEFVANPGHDRWNGGYAGAGCIPKKSAEPHGRLIKIRDAAFAYRVTGVGRYRDAVKNELLNFYAANERLDFSNSTRWCLGSHSLNDINPGFAIAEAMSRAVFAYDLVRSDFPAHEQDALDTWFRHAGHYFRRLVDDDLDKLYASRESGMLRHPARLAQALPLKGREKTHHGGYEIPLIAAYYNNRRAAMIHFVAQTGALLNDDASLRTAERFFKEWLQYSVFPDGTHAEYYRSTLASPENGFAYTLSTVYSMIAVADIFARNGNPALYEFTTGEGLAQTHGGEKNLLLVIRNICMYLDGTLGRYYPGKAGDHTYRINGEHAGWSSVFDTYFSRANIYYRDPYIRSIYLRLGAGTKPYPAKPASAGPYLPWQGMGGTSPGVLFMYGQMEGVVWPYPGI